LEKEQGTNGGVRAATHNPIYQMVDQREGGLIKNLLLCPIVKMIVIKKENKKYS
jgi:hypothetical protein